MVLLTSTIPVWLKLKCGCLARQANKIIRIQLEIEEDSINDEDNGKRTFSSWFGNAPSILTSYVQS